VGEGYSGPNPETGGWRISIEFDPAGSPAADLRCVLRGNQGALSETWLYRWIA
jgi:glucans biosynthesis protein